MRCWKAKKLMPLHRAGELDDRVRGMLDRHVASCRRCAALRASFDAAAAPVDRLRTISPVLHEADDLTGSIMRAVAAGPPARERSWRLHPALHGTHVAAPYAVAAALCALFLVQTYDDAGKIENLEKRMQASADDASRRERTLRETQAASLARVREMARGEAREPALAGLDAGFVLSLFRSSRFEGTPEMERFQKKYPELWSLSLDHGLDTTARRVLRTEGKAFLRDVEDLVRMGER